MCYTAIGEIQIIGLCRIFCCQCIYLFHVGHDTHLFTFCSHSKQGIFNIHLLFHVEGTGNLEVSEAIHLGTAQEVCFKQIDVSTLMQLVINVADILELLEEPFVYLGQVMNLIDGISHGHCFSDDEDTLVGGFLERFVDIFNDKLLVFNETMHTLAYHAQTFLYGFFEGTTYGHHLTYALHAATQFAVYTTEFTQVPTRYLTYHIVQSRFKECAGGLCHRVLQVKQAIAKS